MTNEEAKNYIWRNHCAGDGCPHSVDGVVISCKECPYDFAIRALENVSEKREKWIFVEKKNLLSYLMCSGCGHITNDYILEFKDDGSLKIKDLNFCPECGARMDGDE